MRTVYLEMSVAQQPPEAVYDALADFAAYPEHANAVRSVTIEAAGEGWCESTWEADFRNGVMHWCERDTFLREEGRIEFEQSEGDLERFSGSWVVADDGERTRIEFRAEFDLGLPTLADFLEPVAAQALADNMRALVEGLLGDVELLSANAAVPSV
ncbi:MAG: SRPBCC family protein [Patulibacter sp.]